MNINEEIMKEFKWYDYTEFFKLMSVWLAASGDNHITTGQKLRSVEVGKKMKVMSSLLDRMANNEYSGKSRYGKNISIKMNFIKISQKNCKIHNLDWESLREHAGNSTSIFTYTPDKETYERQEKLSSKHDTMQYEQDKDLFLKLFKKHIESMWD